MGMNYSKLVPTTGVCTSRFPCPLVVEVPGAAGLPWFLLQQRCKKCQEELGVIMVFLATDSNTSTAFVSTNFVPAVRRFVVQDEVDESRVYLVSASQGNEIAFSAAVSHPDIFAFALLSGKFLVNAGVQEAVAAKPRQSANSKLSFISLVVGESDNVRDESQNFLRRLGELRGAMAGTDLHLRFLPGSKHAVWYSAWNMFHDLIWRGHGHPRDYRTLEPLTC